MKKLKCGFANGKCVGSYVGRTSGNHRACAIHLEIYEKNKHHYPKPTKTYIMKCKVTKIKKGEPMDYEYNCVKDVVVHLTTEDWLACKDCHIEENHASNRSDPI